MAPDRLLLCDVTPVNLLRQREGEAHLAACDLSAALHDEVVLGLRDLAEPGIHKGHRDVRGHGDEDQFTSGVFVDELWWLGLVEAVRVDDLVTYRQTRAVGTTVDQLDAVDRGERIRACRAARHTSDR